MKITASRRDEILKDKADYEANRATRKAKYDEQMATYDRARALVFQAIYDKVDAALSPTGMTVDIDVDTSFDGILSVKVSQESDVANQKSRALSWTWKAQLNREGEVVKETSSWSGLQATTAEQLDSLEAILKCLRILNSMDWQAILTADMPNYNDFRLHGWN